MARREIVYAHKSPRQWVSLAACASVPCRPARFVSCLCVTKPYRMRQQCKMALTCGGWLGLRRSPRSVGAVVVVVVVVVVACVRIVMPVQQRYILLTAIAGGLQRPASTGCDASL